MTRDTSAWSADAAGTRWVTAEVEQSMDATSGARGSVLGLVLAGLITGVVMWLLVA